MSLQEKQENNGSTPTIFTIGTVVILFFVSLMLQNSDDELVNFMANVYLFTYKLEFLNTSSFFIAAIISSIIAFVIHCIVLASKNKKFFFLFFSQIIVTYIVYSGAWYYVKTMGLALKDIFVFGNILWGITMLLASIILVALLCFFNYCMTEVCFNKEQIENYSHEQQKKEKKKPTGNNISRISNQEAINRIYKVLEKVEPLINMDLKSEAAINLRKASEFFTKEISIHNQLGLEEMDYYSRVKFLHEQQHISYELYTLLSSIRRLGNRAAHELDDEENFSKNGLLKLHRQLLDHLSEWVKDDQNKVVEAVNDDFDDGDGYEYTDDYEYEEQDGFDDDEDEFEDERKLKKSAAFILLPREKREKMKF